MINLPWGRPMIRTRWGVVAATLATALLSTRTDAQSKPKLHVNPRWKQCSIQLDSSLK